MKNFFKFLGIISIALVIGFSMAGCKNDDEGGGREVAEELLGTWVGSDTDGTLVIDDEAEYLFTSTSAASTGAYTVADTIKIKQMGWMLAGGDEAEAKDGKIYLPDAEVNGVQVTGEVIYLYTIANNTLTIKNTGTSGATIFTGTKQP
jgi:hypothetical protein